MPRSRHIRGEWHMNLVFDCTISSMGLNEVRETEFLNYCQSHGAKNLKGPKLWIIAQDMLAVNALIVIKPYAVIQMQDYDVA